MNLLRETALTWLMPTLQATAGVAVTYTRDATSLTLTAVPGDPRMDVETAASLGLVLSSDARDWLVVASELSLGQPERGDTIVPQEGPFKGWTFQVMGTSGEREFANMDNYGDLLRIHSKRVV